MTQYRVTVINEQGAREGIYCDTLAEVAEWLNGWSDLTQLSIEVTRCTERGVQMVEEEVARSPLGESADELLATLEARNG